MNATLKVTLTNLSRVHLCHEHAHTAPWHGSWWNITTCRGGMKFSRHPVGTGATAQSWKQHRLFWKKPCFRRNITHRQGRPWIERENFLADAGNNCPVLMSLVYRHSNGQPSVLSFSRGYSMVQGFPGNSSTGRHKEPGAFDAFIRGISLGDSERSRYLFRGLQTCANPVLGQNKYLRQALSLGL